MADIYPAPGPARISATEENFQYTDNGGVRKRRTPSEEANSNVNKGDHFISAYNDVFIAPAVDVQPSSQNPLANGATINGISTAAKSDNAGFWAKWKSFGNARARLMYFRDIVKDRLNFHRFPSIGFCPFGRRKQLAQYRTVLPNHLTLGRPSQNPNRHYAGNKIKTTKYTIITFLPKNLFEQFHRFANLYFIFIVLLNWIPAIEAFAKELAAMPVLFVLAVTAVKDIFEDRRRYLADRKVNHSTCRIFNAQEKRYVKTEWKYITVGDFVHLSCNEIIPADILLVRSSDPMGVCYVETSNLDGESNLKQRHVITSRLDKNSETFSPLDFKSTIKCEQPNNQIYKFNGFLLHENADREMVNKNSLLLRGCEVRNTDYIEGIVVYAGHETKAMLNNSGPRYKRTKLERVMNWDIVWCVVILLVMCFGGALGGGVWMNTFENPWNLPFVPLNKDEKLNPELTGFIVFWTFIIILQTMIPISLYVSIEIVKLGQAFFITQDPELYYAPAKKRIQCRALNITEELGQIEYLMSDKTGTLTENQMIFRRCAIAGVDYGSTDINATKEQVDASSCQATKETAKDVRPNIQLQQMLIASCPDDGLESGDNGKRETVFDFFMNMAVCNTVVVNPHPHVDRMNASGHVTDDSIAVDQYANKPGLVGNGLLLNVATPSSREVGQTPVDYPSPRYAKGDFERLTNGHSLGQSKLPAIIATEHHSSESGSLGHTDGSDEDNRSEGGVVEKRQGGPQNGSNGDQPDAGGDSKGRSEAKAFGKKLLQLPMLAKSRLPPMIGRKSHAATPSVSPGYKNPVYEAESPDELALVYASAAYGFRLVKRHLNSITVELPNGQLLKYEILHILPFDSVRKRMSVIVRHPVNKKIILFCKGADTAIIEVLSTEFCQSQRGQMYLYKSQEYLNLYASFGLRTLCLSKRELPVDDYEKWAAAHADAESSLDEDREHLILESIYRIEKDLELLGVTGVEDRLQEGVADCIAALRKAGIKVWVLTGDKIETAVNIAYACKLFAYGMELIQLCTRSEADAETLLQHHLDQFSRRNQQAGDSQAVESENLGIVTDGQTMAYFLTPKLEEKFVQVVSRCTSVLCCRATPLQKAAVVKLVKDKLEGTTLAIGDGANDVSMIQCADVGVGLSGQEGMQAVMASDFAMPQFRFLQRLLLVHGHWCYDRLARMVPYFFYKNALFVFTLFWYQFFTGFTAQIMIDPFYLILHNLVFTSLPPLLLGVFDQDAPAELLFEEHHLYRQGLRTNAYQMHSFWLNIVDALWQSVVCYFTTHFLYYDTSTPLWSFGFLIASALVVCNQLHLLCNARSWTLPIIVSTILSTLAFYVFALSYNALAYTSAAPDSPLWVAERMVSDGAYWLALLLIVVLALLPRVVSMVVINTLYPSDVLVARIRWRLKQKKEKELTAKFSKETKGVTFSRDDGDAGAAASKNEVAEIGEI